MKLSPQITTTPSAPCSTATHASASKSPATRARALRTSPIVGVPVDEEGLVVESLPALDDVFVTPSHQSPTTHTHTHTLSLECRQWLLRKAALPDFVVIANDDEAESLYASEPTPAPQAWTRPVTT